MEKDLIDRPDQVAIVERLDSGMLAYRMEPRR